MQDPITMIASEINKQIEMILGYIFGLLGLPEWLYFPAYVLVLIIIFFLLFTVDLLFIVWMERKLIGRIHHRRSVTETGPFGFFQNIADVVKLLIKEDIYPEKADRFMHNLVPPLLAATALIPVVLIPFGPGIWFLRMNTSVVLFFAIATLVPGLVLLAGWASNSKLPAIGAFRAGLQLISYELPLGLSLLGVVLLAGSLDFVSIVEAQKNIWFALVQPIGAFVFFVASIMELERAPFDVPEAEGEIIVGWRTEYSGIKFGLFYGTEYFKLFVSAAAFTALYLGGWYGPFFPSVIYFVLKLHLVIIMMIWVRITFFRPRPDQLIRIAYTKLIPLAILNLFLVVILAPYISYLL